MVCEEVKMKAQILKMFREADGYISGQQLCEKFGVSRTAVWKVIRQLQEEGYEVEAVRNKGYRIIDSPDVMTKELKPFLGSQTRVALSVWVQARTLFSACGSFWRRRR